MIYRSKKEYIDQYFKSKRFSNSFLRGIIKPHIFYQKMNQEDRDDGEKRHFRIGSALDTLLTRDITEFDKEYYIATVTKPRGKMGEFLDALPMGLHKDSPKELFQDAYNKANYHWGLDNVLGCMFDPSKKSYKADNYDYYRAREMANEKTVLSKDEYEEIMYASKALASHPFIKEIIFNIKRDEDIFTQVPILYEVNGVKCKCMLDFVIVNKTKKTFWPIDLKSTGRSLKGFKSSFLSNGYLTQAGSYYYAIGEFLQGRATILDPELHDKLSSYEGYTLETFSFIVAETNPRYQNKPRIFDCTEADLEAGLYGGITKQGKRYKGFIQLLEDFIWHNEMNYWELPKDIFLHNGRDKIGVFEENIDGEDDE